MVASIERIEQDLAALDAAISSIAGEFHKTYETYLEALGKATRQQLILAAYHLCTQSYPQQFLQLSLHQRQQLQQTLQDLAKQTQAVLMASLQPPLLTSDPPAAIASEDLPSEVLEFSPSPGQNSPTEEMAINVAALLRNLVAREQIPLSPVERLLSWQDNLEQTILQELRAASHGANRLLQQVGLLPQKLPEKVLEAAAKADAEPSSGQPNLLSLMIEAIDPTDGKDRDNKDSDAPSSAILHITTVHLRLHEVEFADSTTAAWRSRVRSLTARLQALARDYQKKQQEHTIASAEAAWRATWVDG